MQKQYKMNISPEILELLGPNLYTNIYYVLAELIANAYDADAKNVYIIKEEDAIIVEDDGVGMDYEHGIKQYLQVAKPTRNDNRSSFTNGGRRRMGRKGIGKLAALSISENVKVITRHGPDLSGFILSRRVPSDGFLEAIPDEELRFRMIVGNGTSIVMENPEYTLNKSLDSWRRNLLRMFPVVSKHFQIHLINDKGELTLNDFDRDIIPQLGTLITIGKEFKSLEAAFSVDFPDIESKILRHFSDEDISSSVKIKTRSGEIRDCPVIIRGWIGTYRSVRGRKKTIEDFPDNYISLFANGKLGAFNIIPEIGRNRMAESYLVGQLHIDAFEDSELPDMAMSNRQGYKTDDPRYEIAIKMIRERLFDAALQMYDVYSDRKLMEKTRKKADQDLKAELELKQQASLFVDKVKDVIAERSSDAPISDNEARGIVNETLSLLGLKREVDLNKKKLLISHASCDKVIADLLYDALVFNNVNPEEILYTSCDEAASRIPENQPLFDYIRDFFVQSVSTQMINVLFVVSEESASRWAPVCEVGAAWVTRSTHKIFTVNGFSPKQPLDINPLYLDFTVNEEGIHLGRVSADVFKEKIKDICCQLKVKPRSDEEIMAFINSRVIIQPVCPPCLVSYEINN